MGRSRRARAAERLAQAITHRDGPVNLRTLLVHGPIANSSFELAETRPMLRVEAPIAVELDDEIDADTGALPAVEAPVDADAPAPVLQVAPRRRSAILGAAALAIAFGGLAAAATIPALRSGAPASTLEASLASMPLPHARSVVEPTPQDLDPIPSPVRERAPALEDEEETIVVPEERTRARSSQARRASRRGARRPQAIALVDEATSALQAGARDDAIVLYERALSADPRSAAAAAGLSTAYFDKGRFDLATAWAEHAVKTDFRNPEYHVLLGDAYYRNAAMDEARRHWQTAAKLGSDRARERLAKLD